MKYVHVYRIIALKTPDVFLNNISFEKSVIQDAFVGVTPNLSKYFMFAFAHCLISTIVDLYKNGPDLDLEAELVDMDNALSASASGSTPEPTPAPKKRAPKKAAPKKAAPKKAAPKKEAPTKGVVKKKRSKKSDPIVVSGSEDEQGNKSSSSKPKDKTQNKRKTKGRNVDVEPPVETGPPMVDQEDIDMDEPSHATSRAPSIVPVAALPVPPSPASTTSVAAGVPPVVSPPPAPSVATPPAIPSVPSSALLHRDVDVPVLVSTSSSAPTQAKAIQPKTSKLPVYDRILKRLGEKPVQDVGPTGSESRSGSASDWNDFLPPPMSPSREISPSHTEVHSFEQRDLSQLQSSNKSRPTPGFSTLRKRCRTMTLDDDDDEGLLVVTSEGEEAPVERPKRKYSKGDPVELARSSLLIPTGSGALAPPTHRRTARPSQQSQKSRR